MKEIKLQEIFRELQQKTRFQRQSQNSYKIFGTNSSFEIACYRKRLTSIFQEF